ncbi:hypothetical protein BGZ52_000250 [Haplosporangium bisporale]|nr:hypothetical protein BGZ52_000250 [Haplosporangium bisporale]
MTHRADPTGHTGPTTVPTNVFFSTTGDSSSSDDSSQQQQQQQQQQQSQWPSLLNIRQIVTAFVLETITNARPLRDKLDVVIRQLWERYLQLVYAYPILTTFLSVLVFFSSGPIIVFACVAGASLGFLVGIAAVIVIIIQSIVVTIAGTILFFVLGIIFVLTMFTFFWIVAGFFAFKCVRNLAVSLREHHLQQQQNRSSPQTGHSYDDEKSRGGQSALDSQDALVPKA